jgi:hypothetical protein
MPSKDGSDSPGRRGWVLNGSERVRLNVYDFPPVKKASLGLCGIEANHMAVEVYGWEYSYGTDGVTSGPPRSDSNFIFKEAADLGRAKVSTQRLKAILENLCTLWHGKDYSPFSQNCVHFADRLCSLLGVERVPEQHWLGVKNARKKGFCCLGWDQLPETQVVMRQNVFLNDSLDEFSGGNPSEPAALSSAGQRPIKPMRPEDLVQDGMIKPRRPGDDSRVTLEGGSSSSIKVCC